MQKDPDTLRHQDPLKYLKTRCLKHTSNTKCCGASMLHGRAEIGGPPITACLVCGKGLPVDIAVECGLIKDPATILAVGAAKALRDKWSIGSFDRFLDEPPDFDGASVDEVVAVLKPMFETLPASADPVRPSTRGELAKRLSAGEACEVAAHVSEMTTIMLTGWLNVHNFFVVQSHNPGWVIYQPCSSRFISAVTWKYPDREKPENTGKYLVMTTEGLDVLCIEEESMTYADNTPADWSEVLCWANRPTFNETL